MASAVLLFAAVAAAVAVAAEPAHAAEPYAQTDYPGLGVSVQTIADGLAVPWSIDWLPDGTAIFTERGGTVSVIRDGLPEPEAVLSVAVGGGAEAGLLGVAVDPDFEDNGYVYLYYTYTDLLSPPYNRIERYTYYDGHDGSGGNTATGLPRLGDAHVILDRIPASSWHDGGRIQFGPDGMLYAATGDAIVPELSQDASSLAGKILRMDRDGGVPTDNPWEGSLVYSMGHRNPQGMDWDRDGRMIITEHGPSGRLGVGHDEINVIVKGGNYGWPVVIGDSINNGGVGGGGGGGTPYENPAFHTGGSTWAPSGAEFYESDVIPEWQGRYFVATLLGRTLQMVQVSPDGTVVPHTPLFGGEFGRLRDVQTGPDGHLYVLTSNRDGRGAPAPEDDRILRIAPLYEAARGDDSGAVAPEQQLRVLIYDGPETTDTGPLVAALRHPGYEVSSLAFDIGQKSLDFGFARSGTGGGHGYADSSLSLYVQRPLVSAPFEVVVYDKSGGMVPVSEASGHAGYLDGGDDGNAADPAAAYAVRHGPDHYIITIGTGLESGRVSIIGTHVVPEYPSAVLVMAAAAVAVVAALVLALAAPPSLAHGGLLITRSAGARNVAGCP
ncbi:MAG: PQQ-dependent sugar dehydrogenase [Nitrosopumilaceae archaeon]|nr:PQQ-dependent sugar dehydrogenase [Nitrosopumilaceae archaeon]